MRVQIVAFTLALVVFCSAQEDAQLNEEGNHNKRPEPEVTSMDVYFNPGHKCTKWEHVTLIPKHENAVEIPEVAPHCKKWKKNDGDQIVSDDPGRSYIRNTIDAQKADMESQIYDTTTVHLVDGCKHWTTAAKGKDVTTFCTDWEGMPKSVDDIPEVDKRSDTKTPTSSSAPPKGLLKEFQKSVHTLQSQLAQVQHKHQSQPHLATIDAVDDIGTAKQEANSDNFSQRGVLQDLQHTAQSMQSKLAKAKFSLHTFSTKSGAIGEKKLDSAGLNQGVLQDLQHSVRNLQGQLASARHSLHAHTGTKESAKKLAQAGFNQENLQAMQHTANKLQSQLAKARHTLHAHVGARDVLPIRDE